MCASTRYAAVLVGEGVDRPSDLIELEDGDWPQSIKPLHLKKLKALTLSLSLSLSLTRTRTSRSSRRT